MLLKLVPIYLHDPVRYIKQVAFDSYNIVSKQKPLFNIFKSEDLQILKSMFKIPNIIITKLDKGRGVVLMDKIDYASKMHTLLENETKFNKCSIQDGYKLSLVAEDRVHRVLRSLKNKKVISSSLYSDIHPTGSGPGVLYGLPKVHKPGLAP